MNNDVYDDDILVELHLEREEHEESRKYIRFLERILHDNGFKIYPYDSPNYDVYDLDEHTIFVVDSEGYKQYNFYKHFYR